MRWAWSALTLVIVLLCAAAGRAQGLEGAIIRGIVFQGAEPLPATAQQALGEAAAPLIGVRYDAGAADALRDAVAEVSGVQGARVRAEAVADGVQLVVEITPNPLIRRIDFPGNRSVPADALMKAIHSRVGQAFSPELAREDAGRIQDELTARGYILNRVTDVSFDPREGVLTFTVQEAVISEIRIEGNERTRAETIRRSLLVQPGEVYYEPDLRTSLANLRQLGLFSQATFTPTAGEQPGQVILTVTVEELRTGNLQVGGSYSDVGGFSGYIIYTEANLFGTAQRVSVQIQGGGTDIYQLSYFNPFIDRRGTNLGVNLYKRQAEREVFPAGMDSQRYLADRNGGSVTLARRLAPALVVSATLRAERVRANTESGEALLDLLTEPSDVRSLALNAVRDTRADPLYPTGGSYAMAGTELAGLLGGADFTKLTAEYRRYWLAQRLPAPAPDSDQVPEETKPPRVFAARAYVGTSAGTPPFLDQFFLGGSETLRGYETDRFPGQNVLLLSAEYRVPLSTSLQVVAFADAGDAWGGRFAEAFGDGNFNFRYNLGLGLRVVSPLGPIRFDFAHNDEGDNNFQFGIGPTF